MNRVKKHIELPTDVLVLKEAFKKHGHALFLVGGAVRDTLLGKKIKDFDLATDAEPDKIVDIVKMETKFSMIGIGEAFGVINVITSSDQYEIATFRSDGEYLDGRRPDTVEFSTIEEDVKRRDFTLNAMFYDIEAGEIVDMVGGLIDIETKIIRTVGSAKDRFEEDKVRIMRGIRFANSLDFNMDLEMILSIDNDNDLSLVSKERIRDEFIKSIKSTTSIFKLLKTFQRYNLFQFIFGDMNVKINHHTETDYIVVIALMLRYNSPSKVEVKLNELGYSKKEVKQIVFLLNIFDMNTLAKVVALKKQQLTNGISVEQIKSFSKIIDLGFTIDAFIKFELSVSGGSVIEEFGIQGPAVGLKVIELESANFTKLLQSTL